MIPTETLDDGRIRLFLGDCRDVLPNVPAADCVLVDPPYGIAFRSGMREATPQFDKIANDEFPFVEWIPLLKVKATAAMICFYRWDVQEPFRLELEANDWAVKSQIVWWKPGGGMGDLYASFCPEHEVALFAVRGGFAFCNGRPMSVFKVPKVPPGNMIHPTQKPVALIFKIMQYVTKTNDVVCDPCMGSGTTGIAAAQSGRRFIGIEQDPTNFANAVARIANAIKKKRDGFGLESSAFCP